MRNHPEITIHHLANVLKISASTVSRALNDNNRISEKTRKLVQQKAAEMGYRPNVLAANLRSRKTNTIGVVDHGLTVIFSLQPSVALRIMRGPKDLM
jgi:LacI family transcriptional regulator